MWLPILKKGQVASGRNGAVHADDSTLTVMVSRYDPTHHEAPVVIGAAREVDPAYGWVKSLAKRGDYLLADVNVIDKPVADELRHGQRRISKVGFYPDMRLRHIILFGNKPQIEGDMTRFTQGSGYMAFDFEEGELRDDPGSILQCKTMEICLDRGCSFGEAFHIACLEIPDIAEAYAQTIWRS